ncbi:hypothetical protein ABZ532_11345 [Streptomyces sp. NPDC019396]|uniref:hypothetical protein n=1 Tax=Streptomyces sp. NPDC019396 TaxID=3154687 RepID=UPI0033DF467D
MLPEAEKARTKLLHQVDEQRHPKRAVTMAFLLDRWHGVAELDEDTSYERAEGIIRNYLKPTFGDMKAGKVTAEMLELFYSRLRKCRKQCEGRRNGKTDPKTKQRHTCVMSDQRRAHISPWREPVTIFTGCRLVCDRCAGAVAGARQVLGEPACECAHRASTG